MKKIFLIIFSLIAIVVLTIIIGIREKESKNEKLVVAEVTHSVFYTPWYVSIENGYFKDENIDIEVVLTPGADKVGTAVLSKDVNIGFSGPEATVYIYNNSKEKLLTFASLTKRDGQFIVGDCKLKDNFTLNDLKGKKILAGRNGGMPLLMFKYALYENGINESDVNIDTSIEFSALSGAYISGQGDFVNLFEPNALNIEKQGYGCPLTSLGNLSGIVPYTAFYAREEFINNNKDLIQRFNNALNKGIKFTKENDSETIAKTIINQFPDTSLKDLIILVDRYKNADSWYDNTYVNSKDYNKLIDILYYGKFIDNKLDSNILITNEFNK